MCAVPWQEQTQTAIFQTLSPKDPQYFVHCFTERLQVCRCWRHIYVTLKYSKTNFLRVTSPPVYTENAIHTHMLICYSCIYSGNFLQYKCTGLPGSLDYLILHNVLWITYYVHYSKNIYNLQRHKYQMKKILYIQTKSVHAIDMRQKIIQEYRYDIFKFILCSGFYHEVTSD